MVAGPPSAVVPINPGETRESPRSNAVLPIGKEEVADDANPSHLKGVEFGSPTKSEGSENADEDDVPTEWFWVFLRKSQRENFLKDFILYGIFILLFTIIADSLRATTDGFRMGNTILAHTSDEAFPGANFLKTFHDIANDPDWWEVVETVLIPASLTENYFTNGESRNKNRHTRGGAWPEGRMRNTISYYNTLTSPIRFRNWIVHNESCSTPESSSELARPCWGAFSPSVQFTEPFGEEYGNKFMTGLTPVSGKEGFGGSYGSAAHVVDLPLNYTEAMDILAKMKNDLWLREGTRGISIESSWYNPNYDISAYVRWHADISEAGRYQPWVEIKTLRIQPYSRVNDKRRAVVEGLFALMLVYYWGIEVSELMYWGPKTYFANLWNLLELTNLILYVVILLYWMLYVFNFNREMFQVVSNGTHEYRPDLLPLALRYNWTANLGAFNIVWAYVKIFKFLQMYPQTSTLWRTLALSMNDILPFLFVLFIVMCGFTYCGHWLFGFMLVDFHSWSQSFSTLVQCLGGGLPYDDMKAFTPMGAALFTAAWVMTMAMILLNLLVGILCEAQAEVTRQIGVETEKLEEVVGESSKVGVIGGLAKAVTTRYAKNVKIPGISSEEETIFDATSKNKAIQEKLAELDMHKADQIRDAVVEGESLQKSDLYELLGEDRGVVDAFVERVKSLAKEKATSIAEREANEQEELGEACGDLQRLERKLVGMRKRLHTAFLGPDGGKEHRRHRRR